MQFLAPLAHWLAASSLSALIGEVTWIVPAVQSLHILAISVVISGVFLVDLRVLGAFESDGVHAFVRRYLPWVWWALLVLLLTGIVMIIGEPDRALLNATFAAKMALVLLAVALTAMTQLKSEGHFWQDRRTFARLLALASLAVWVAVIVCGRWIAYTQDSGA